MDTLERLHRAALTGDSDAARHWAEALRRRGQSPDAPSVARIVEAAADEDLAGLVLALDAVELAVARLQTAWRRDPAARVDALARALGLGFGASVREALDALIAQANASARVRLVERAHLADVLVRARLATHGLAATHAGEGSIQAKTGIVVAVRDDVRGQIVVGATRGGAMNASPGRGWPALQPWSRDLSRNVDKAQRWARETANNRVAIPLVELRQAAAAAIEARAAEVVDPIARLITGAPGRGAFNKLVSQVNKTRDTAAAEQRAADIARAIGDWPPAMCTGGVQWLKSLAVDHRKGTWRPGWRLIRRLELDRGDRTRLEEIGLDALIASPFADTLEEIALGDLPPKVLSRVLAAHAWPGVRRIELRAASRRATPSVVQAMPEALRQRVALLSLLHGEPERLPADLWPAPSPEAVELTLGGLESARDPDAWLPGVLSAVGVPSALRIGLWTWGDALEILEGRDDLSACRHLSIETAELNGPAFERALSSVASRCRLETLAILGFVRGGSLQQVTGSDALSSVRRFMFGGEVSWRFFERLRTGPLVRGLEALFVATKGRVRIAPIDDLVTSGEADGLRVLGLDAFTAAGLWNDADIEDRLPATLERVVLLPLVTEPPELLITRLQEGRFELVQHTMRGLP